MTRPSPLSELIAAQKRGEARGIAAVCSANPWVIGATLQQALATGEPLLIESTCNQVNQFGGYTGWTPAQFVQYLRELADQKHFPFERITIGGDHLGPSPWQGEPAATALEKARTLVRQCVAAGYNKIHLDASMRCADDDSDRPLKTELAAARAADLALAAEEAASQHLPEHRAPYYVIGTEVPLPGGARESEETLSVTTPPAVAETIEVTQQAFLARGLAQAWTRVIAVVVQPGVEYGNSALVDYDPARAAGLARFIEHQDNLVYEAHSTDYQLARALRQLVIDHFAILKVGPALTFAHREGVFALACIEEELFARKQAVNLSGIREAMEAAMLVNPAYWSKYYQGDAQTTHLARQYSFSDRSRYYWPVPEVQLALSRLIQNLQTQPIPLTLLSQYLPLEYSLIREGALANEPRAILLTRIRQVLSGYSYACGYLNENRHEDAPATRRTTWPVG